MKKILAVLGVVGLTIVFNASGKSKPNSMFTYPDFCTHNSSELREIRYSQRIAVCHRSVSSSIKDEVYDLYQIPESDRSQYTIDHLIPLSLGGSNRIMNLWPQHRDDSTAQLEFRLYLKVRDGDMLIQEAYNVILKEKYE